MNHQKVPLNPGLHFVGVPIGSARDITLRALDVLASADVLAAEDTRSLRKLMDIHGIPLGQRRIHAVHDHSGQGTDARLVSFMKDGQSVAYASEAGMPLIADPGFELAQLSIAEGMSVTCAPGPSAVVTALALGGLPTDRFFFAGFLPNARRARQTVLAELKDSPATLVFYESPKRIAAMLDDAASVLGPDRKGAICRELTKKFEEIRRGSLQDLALSVNEKPPKGEIVVLIDRSRSEKISEVDLETDLRAALSRHSLRDAVDLVAHSAGIARKQVYKLALAIQKDQT